jgi:splicing factor 3B subunit 2
MRPKAGKMDIDYHVLHDAFFVNQTKPPMTLHADLYYEGKEYEAKLKNKRPGHLSDELMRALGMTEGHKSPAPWLYNMQRFGPPPSYPNLKLPGVNWPIPEGCRYGTLEGEWGKPPVDEYGRPLYGDVFGTEHKEESSAPLSVELWGVLQEEEQVDSEDESEEELENDEDEDMEDEDIHESGLESVQSGVSGLSTPSGLTTPDVVNIRKDGTGSETPTEVRSLYTVIEEKKTSVGGGLFGTDRTYVLPTGNQGIEQKRAAMRGQVNVALNPDELETLDAASLKRKYDQQLRDQSNVAVAERSEVDEVIEEEARKKKRKTGQATTSTKKKYKDFKF